MDPIRHDCRSLRHGLAPLEMVLCLPLLLFIMALMINFGIAAAWKVRTLSIARGQAFANSWPRTGATNPRPAYWPQTASASTAGPENAASLEDPRVLQPVARGPLPQGLTVRPELLDPTRGLRSGKAGIERDYALMKKLGTYQLKSENWMLDDKWQYQRMGIPDTIFRRIPFLYELTKAPAPRAAYLQAAAAVYRASLDPRLQPLDNDPDFIYYGALFGWGGAPDFHPLLNQFCTLDKTVAQQHTDELVDRVHHLPNCMTARFLDLYQRVLTAAQAMIQAAQQGNQSLTAVLPALQTAIADAQAKIPILSAFQGRLGQGP